MRTLQWSLLTSLAIANPIAEVGIPASVCRTTYDVDDPGHRVAGAAFTGNYAVSGSKSNPPSTTPAPPSSTPSPPSHPRTTNPYPTDGVLTDSSTYSIGVTVTVGGSLGISTGEVFSKLISLSASLSASVSTTTTSGNTGGASYSCPAGPWHCSLSITPTVQEVSGTKVDAGAGLEGCAPGEQRYVVQYPVKNPEGLALLDAELCVCDDGHAGDAGAPALKCPMACPLVGP
ncbi:hypothetical protein MMC21_004228 [Puttea exsequens]|nr:hypothetical protein [Puttea exsequens]